MTDQTAPKLMFSTDTYVSFAQTADCKVCGRYEDLRMGACFDCADQVTGREIPGGHELWVIKNPSNRWKVVADQ